MRSRERLFSIQISQTSQAVVREFSAAGLLLLLTAGFFWRVVTGEVFQPADGGDLVSFLFPTYRLVASQLTQWSLPLWNPYLYAGAPLIGDIQAGAFYPPNFFLFVLRPHFSYATLTWFVLGHIYWAGLGLYLLLRTLRWDGRPISRSGALFGALAFQLSDPFLIHLGNLNLIAVLSWLPWVLALALRGYETGRLSWAAGAGLLFAVANYAGHAQSSLYIGVAVVSVGGLWSISKPRRVGRSVYRQVGQFVLQASVTLLVALLLSLPIVLPAIELSQHTARSAFTYQEMAAFSLAPTQAIGLLTPGFFGRGPALHWSLWDRVETPYAGVATILLGAAAMLLAGARRRSLFLWVGLALFGFITALGVYAILHGWLTLILPGFDRFRAPARALILWTLSIAVLAGIGLDLVGDRANLLDSAFRRLSGLLQFGGLLLVAIVLPLVYLALLLTQGNEVIFLRTSVAALALTLATGSWLATWLVIQGYRAGWWPRGWTMGLLIAILFLDLSAAGAYTDISPNDPAIGFEHPAIAAFLQGDPNLFRIDTRTEIDDLWQPDTAILYGLQDVGGIANPLTLRRWERLWEATGGRQSALYDMLNVKYVVVRDGVPLPSGKFVPVLDAPGELSLFRNETVLPRAWLVESVQIVADEDAALAALQTEGFAPQQMAIVDAQSIPESLTSAEREKLIQAAATSAPLSGTKVGTRIGIDDVEFLDYDSAQMKLRVTSEEPRYLVLSELWYPGWHATINDEPVPILRANGALRALLAPAGTSVVQLWFWPSSLIWGIVGGALGAALLLLIILWERRR